MVKMSLDQPSESRTSMKCTLHCSGSVPSERAPSRMNVPKAVDPPRSTSIGLAGPSFAPGGDGVDGGGSGGSNFTI